MKKSFPLLIPELEQLTEAIEQAGPCKLICDLVRSRLDRPDMQALFINARPIPERNLVDVMVCDYAPSGLPEFSHLRTLFTTLCRPAWAVETRAAQKLFLAAAILRTGPGITSRFHDLLGIAR
jgi:hypothetical protein